MTQNKAISTAIKIVFECKKSQKRNDGHCGDCPFKSSKGCIISNGNGIPEEWLIMDMIRDSFK